MNNLSRERRGIWMSMKIGAGNETRTRDPDLGKVVLYQLSYSRIEMLGAPCCKYSI